VETTFIKLSFLGRTYDASFDIFKTPESAATARFWGQSYYLRCLLTVAIEQKPQRRFRGIKY